METKHKNSSSQTLNNFGEGRVGSKCWWYHPHYDDNNTECSLQKRKEEIISEIGNQRILATNIAGWHRLQNVLWKLVCNDKNLRIYMLLKMQKGKKEMENKCCCKFKSTILSNEIASFYGKMDYSD